MQEMLLIPAASQLAFSSAYFHWQKQVYSTKYIQQELPALPGQDKA